jgi:hypothetical protein
MLLGIGLAWTIVDFVRFERLGESYADDTAFRALSTEADRERVLRLVEREVSLAEESFGSRHFHTRLWRDRLRSLRAGRRGTLYMPSGGTVYDPAMAPFAVASVAAAFSAWGSPPPSTARFWIYLGWAALCQAAAIGLFVLTRWIDAGLRIRLNSIPVRGGYHAGAAAAMRVQYLFEKRGLSVKP